MSKPRTAAEQQIELLRQLRAAKPKARQAAPAAAHPSGAPDRLGPAAEGPAPTGGAFEIVDGPPQPRPKQAGPSLPVSREQWKRLRERQSASKEFRTRKAMGDWAAELLLALPPQCSRLEADARGELFKRMREWAEARGLR
jgi:hypothetical protein